MSTPVLMSMNMKGGVGKTVVSVSLGFQISWFLDKDVLLIDYDPQSNASYAFLKPEQYFDLLKKGRSLTSALVPNLKPDDPFSIVNAVKSPLPNAEQYATKVRNWYYIGNPQKKGGSLSIIPSSLELMRLALNRLPEVVEGLLLKRWQALIESAKKAYDCVIIDCHPAGSFFTKSAILASDVVVIPVTTDAYAAAGLGMMRNFVDGWKQSGGAREFVVIFNNPNNCWDSAVETEIRDNPRFKTHCLTASLHNSRLFSKIASRHQMVSEQRVPHNRTVSAQVQTVTKELIEVLINQGVVDKSWKKL
ncbi:MAG: ParA family protein [Dehalococcoidia bacterium]